MNLRHKVCALILGVMLAPLAAQAQAGEPGRCPNDSKLINGRPTQVYGEGLGTFWDIVIKGLNAAEFTDEQKIAFLNGLFGTTFDNLADLEKYNQDQTSENWDLNKNGYVCLYELRGTRAYLDNPFVNLVFFGISDDKISKK